MNYKPKHGDMEMWLICTAGETKREEMKNMKVNPDGTYTVKFEVGGVELDFSTVAKRIDDSINALVESKAQKLLDSKYGSLLQEIYDIQSRLKNQKKDLFKYEWENEDNERIPISGFGDNVEIKKCNEYDSDKYVVKGRYFEIYENPKYKNIHYNYCYVDKNDFINPFDIEGIVLFNQEIKDPNSFWSQHKLNGTLESFQKIAQYIPKIKELFDNGMSLNEIRTSIGLQSPMQECINTYFVNTVIVLYKNERYFFLGDGRHRILAARQAKVDIPVQIIKEE